MLKPHLLIIPFLLACHSIEEVAIEPPPSQLTETIEPTEIRLVVGITVDQMRYDYLSRYWEDYSDVGFKRIMEQGFDCKQANYSYAPTFTGPGHASIFSGTTPSYHGIIGNNWYVRDLKREMYCAEDTSARGIGVKGSAGKMSPVNLKTTSLGDQMKLASNFRSKSFGVSMKDRGAILPAGRSADAAYWWIGKDIGHWVSSTYYMEDLPQYVKDYNASEHQDQRIAEGWNLLRPASVYDESIADNNPHEAPFRGKNSPTFPYNLAELAPQNGSYEILKSSPHGNQMVADFGKLLIEQESLGQDEHTDLLTLSFSSTDYIGHQFGPQSMEAQDMYLRLDQTLGDLLSYLDEQVGHGKYIIFLTADHGAAHVPSYLQKHNMAPSYWNSAALEEEIEVELNNLYGSGEYIEKYSNDQIYLNKSTLEEKKIRYQEITDAVVNMAVEYEGVSKAVSAYHLTNNDFTEGVLATIQNGFSQKSSGDIILVLEPGWITYGPQGTTHGTAYPYDTHVPSLFYGGNIPSGSTQRVTHVVDIVATVCAILNIQAPNACVGQPITEIFEND
ncbi:MAG: alkaline phosphatase PafA [Bacteroidota bacterium]